MIGAARRKTDGSGKRWWLWLALLAVALWLAVFGDKSPADGSAALSLPTRSAPAAVPGLAPQAKPGAQALPETLEPLIPRAQLMAAAQPSGTTSAAKSTAPGAKPPGVMRDLFSGKNWNPPPPPAPVVVSAPVAPPLPYAFLGKKLEGDGWEVYLSRGEQTFIVREGMSFDTHYRVDKIAPPSLALTYLPLGQAQTLSIGDAR